MNERSFTIKEIAGHLTSIFLAEDENGSFLLDGGCRLDVERIETAMQLDGKPISDLCHVAVSHMHPDHAGGAPRMRKRWGIPVSGPAGCDNWYRGFTGWLQHKVDIMLALYSAGANGQPWECLAYPRRLKPDTYLNDGDPLPGFPDWIALTAPGHTAHDMVLYHERSATLYAADIAIFRGGRYMLPFPVPFPHRMQQTLEKLSGLAVKTLLLAHGGLRSLDDGTNVFTDLMARLHDPQPEQFRKLAPLCRLAPDTRRPDKHPR